MRNEFTAIIERDGDWYIAYCPEIPGANGQGRTVEECKASLAEAIDLILEDRREDGFRGATTTTGSTRWRSTSSARLRAQARRTPAFPVDKPAKWPG